MVPSGHDDFGVLLLLLLSPAFAPDGGGGMLPAAGSVASAAAAAPDRVVCVNGRLLLRLGRRLVRSRAACGVEREWLGSERAIAVDARCRHRRQIMAGCAVL